MTNLSIIDKLKRSKILDLLQEGKRIDGRALDESRPLVIDTGVIPHANGSARARLGDTEIVSGIKIQPDRPFPDMGDKGNLYLHSRNSSISSSKCRNRSSSTSCDRVSKSG